MSVHQILDHVSKEQTAAEQPLRKSLQENRVGKSLSDSYGWRFWAIFPGLCLSSFLTALDATIVSTALPTIVDELHSAELYVWIINSYTLSITAVQPLYGQAADIFGRKVTMVTALILFLVGSGVCGGAMSTAMLIAGRVVQGLGGGGISVMPSMIICDLVPLRQRQRFTGIVYVAFAIGTFIGPILGGTLTDHAGWRWIFNLNLIVGGIALVLILLFLKVKHGRIGTVLVQLSQIDVVGNIMLMASVTSILLALTWAGTTYSWSSSHTLAPLVLGVLGLVGFMLFECSRWCPQPTMPLSLFSNRVSLLGYSLTFLHGITLYWVSFFLPVYFQGCLGASPQRSGIDTLASVIPLVPAGIGGGILIARTGRYKPDQVLGYALMTIGFGLFTILDEFSSTIMWVMFQIVFAIGGGLVLTALLPAIQAPLADSETATATATWGFIQSFGFIWGASVPSVIFNARFEQLLPTISDVAIRETLSHGNAYEHASKAFTESLSGAVRSEVVRAFVYSLKLVWQVAISFATCGFLLACLIGEVPLREDLQTHYGYDEGNESQG